MLIKKIMGRQIGLKLSAVPFDRGDQSPLDEFKSNVAEYGMQHHLSAPYIPE